MVENGVGKEFLYYNGELLAESNPLGNVVSRYILGYGVSAGWNREKSGYHYYHLDEQNSTAYITGGGGEVENRYEYDAFGAIQNSREELPNRILYTGQQYDQTSGQYYLRARFYNPVIGRFVQEDVYRGDGLNLYAYCKNNPVVYYDPSGYKDKRQTPCKEETSVGDSNTQRNGVPVKEKTKTSNGLDYQSNPKHTPGQPGNRPNAGIEPKNSLDLFGESVPSTLKPNQRFTYDAETSTLHRFYNDGNGTWHWSGSTNQGANSITGSQVPNDIKNIFGLSKKGW